MPDTIEDFSRQEIKKGLSFLNAKQQTYSREDIDKLINDIIDQIPEEKLSQIWTQVEDLIQKGG